MDSYRNINTWQLVRMTYLENTKPYENRSRKRVERTKDNLKNWGMLEGTLTTCECGMQQTMKHFMQCPICPYSCSQEDVINGNDNAIDIARFWAETT